MTKEEMLTEIIEKFGFEDENTIMFAQFVETKNESFVKRAFYLLEMMPLEDED